MDARVTLRDRVAKYAIEIPSCVTANARILNLENTVTHVILPVVHASGHSQVNVFHVQVSKIETYLNR